MYWYYSELVEKVHRYSKDVHILTMLRQAFTRPAWRDAFQTINRKLDDLRKLYSAGLAKDQIREYETGLEVRDDKIAEELNIIRGDCLDILNKVLTENNLDIVENELLRYRI